FGFVSDFGFRISDLIRHSCFVIRHSSKPMSLLVVGLSHHTSPVEVRERFAFSEARIPATLELIRSSSIADEAVILSTCNRVEIYAATTLPPHESVKTRQDLLVRYHDYRDPLTDEIYPLAATQRIEHFFKVARRL